MDTERRALLTPDNSVVRHEQTELHARATNALLWKIDLRLIPLLTLFYFFSFLDRVNIGNARLFGLEKDLHLLPSEYNWAISIFFFSYVLCGLPSNLLMKKVGPSKWISGLMFTWGTITILMAFVRNFVGLLAARFCLAYGIGQLDNLGGLSGWQWIFIFEGVPTVCLALFAYKVLADYPSTAQWLDQIHKDILTERLRADLQMIGDADDEYSFHQIRLVLLDWKVWFYMLIQLSALTTVYCISLFLPSIIKNMGYDPTISQLLSAPPYCVACLITIFSAWNAGRLNERSNHVMIYLLLGIGGFLYLRLATEFLYLGAFIACIGVFNSNNLILSWVTTNIGGKTKRGVAIGLVVASGSIGGIVSGQIYRANDEPYYHRAHSIVIGIMGFNFILVLMLKLLLTNENRRRRNLSPEERQKEIIGDGIHPPLDQHPDFVYVT